MSTASDRPLFTSPAVLLAAGTSCAVIAAGVLGSLTAPVVGGALGAAAAIAVLRYREGRPSRTPHVLTPLPEQSAPVVILAARARPRVVAAGHSDAA